MVRWLQVASRSYGGLVGSLVGCRPATWHFWGQDSWSLFLEHSHDDVQKGLASGVLPHFSNILDACGSRVLNPSYHWDGFEHPTFSNRWAQVGSQHVSLHPSTLGKTKQALGTVEHKSGTQDLMLGIRRRNCCGSPWVQGSKVPICGPRWSSGIWHREGAMVDRTMVSDVSSFSSFTNRKTWLSTIGNA